MIKARVSRSSQREFDCILEDTKESVVAIAKGSVLKNGEVVVGDYVLLEKQTGDNEKYQIIEVLERRTKIYRRLVRENKIKITCSNVDYLVILNSVSKPNFKRGIVDRFLIRAVQWEIPAIVIFNKMDQYNPKKLDISFEEGRLKELGVECFEISALDKSYAPKYLSKGIAELKEFLRNKTAVFLGQSGVGKSHTISTLSDGKIQLLSKDIGKKGKGSHTTTWSELLDCGQFSLIDSPGIRTFAVDDLLIEELNDYFPDLHDLFTQCKFKDCKHLPESNGCYFNDLPNNRESDLILSRLEFYHQIMDEIDQVPSWKKSF